ncbi:hypothetical protein LPB03_08455 [Polaribacter vadi]|uniref:Glycosyl transferase family 1 domain-containing protein n=1 Tax=Polaribacter vadi TaxID=1774273 RepID=A0A1B8U2U5_9FLAO|nr:glycosyltransferase [Polaribacter vadi]AOW17495.1 hypothetical protein LPB03_08455 [Polaribacter vadi]OBY66186.1 hypothetical protein LPB3_01840 [Polaribacter vadi]
MKVLFITNLPSPYRVNFFSELAKYCELTVFFEGKRTKDKEIIFNWNDKNILSFNAIFFNHFFNEFKISFSIIKKALFGDFDKIVICCYNTRTQSLLIILFKILNKEYYFETDGGLLKQNESKLNIFFKKLLISNAKSYFSTGDQCDKYLMNYGAKKDEIVRYSFTSLYKSDVLKKLLTKEQKNKFKSKLGIPYKKIIIGVGRFISLKGFDTLIRGSVLLNKDVGVYIIGGKPTEEYIKIKEKLESNNVHFIDFLAKKELDDWYFAADIFVLPTRGDVWGLVINEAMSKGLPVVTTNMCPAGLELIADKECIFTVDDYDYLKNILKKISEDDDYAYKLSRNNLETIRQKTFENMAIEHRDEFKKDD